MNRIFIGNSATGYTQLHGPLATAPFLRASVHFEFSSQPTVTEKIICELKGTPAEIQSGISSLGYKFEQINGYKAGVFTTPTYIGFRVLNKTTLASGDYFYVIPDQIHLETNPAGYQSSNKGSVLLTIHYRRPNYFDGAQEELPISGRFGNNITGGATIYNHTDAHPTNGSSVLINKVHNFTELPAPLRIEFRNTTSTTNLQNIYIGAYHHPTHLLEDPFFLFAPEFIGGTLIWDAGAIQEHFRRYTWSATAWSPLFSYTITNTWSNLLNGRTYRPYLRFFNKPAYTDLYAVLKLQLGSFVIYESDPVYYDPNFHHLVFNPLELPPNQLLGEYAPHHIEFVFYFKKSSGATYTMDIDQLVLWPLDYSASFIGFNPMLNNHIFIDDNHRGLHNTRISSVTGETVGHIRQGGPLLLFPGSNTRLFFLWLRNTNFIEIGRTAEVRIFYRKRVSVL